MRKIFFISVFLLFSFFHLTQSLWACACGCQVFDVGTSSMFPSSTGGTAYFDYDFMDQTANWHKSSKASADDNDDKQIRSNFLTLGGQYMFNRRWGIQIELPYDHRYFKTSDDTGDVVSFSHSAVGDLRFQGVYTGFSPDMSTGLTFGVKIPTGDWQFPGFDRDVQIGSGSTDLLLGAFHRGTLTTDGAFNYFAQDLLDQPFLTQGGYLPGTEDDAALGIYYRGWVVSSARVTPIIELLNSYRARDRGWAADPTNSGYERLLIAPAIELDYKRIMVFFDVGFPLYQYTNGNQLVSSVFYKVTLSYMF